MTEGKAVGGYFGRHVGCVDVVGPDTATPSAVWRKQMPLLWLTARLHCLVAGGDLGSRVSHDLRHARPWARLALLVLRTPPLAPTISYAKILVALMR
jgi:hypothetical protein